MVSAKCSPASKLSVNRSRCLETPHTEVTKTEFISFSLGPQGGGYIFAVRLIYRRSRTAERLGPTALGGLAVLREHGAGVQRLVCTEVLSSRLCRSADKSHPLNSSAFSRIIALEAAIPKSHLSLEVEHLQT